MGETAERRNLSERGAIVRRIINDVINNPSVTLSVETLQVWLNVPVDAARRILARLASSGVVRKYRPACSCAAHYLVNSPCGADRSVVHLDRCFTFTITEPLRGPSRRPEEQIG